MRWRRLASARAASGMAAQLLFELAFGGDARGREAGDAARVLRAGCGGQNQNERHGGGWDDSPLEFHFAHPAYLSGATAKCKDGVRWARGAQLLNGTSARSRGSRRYRPSQVSTPKVTANAELKAGWPTRTLVHTAPPR